MAMSDDDDKNVNVNLIEDVDAFTLTAVGFGLIAFNFLVLANVSTALIWNSEVALYGFYFYFATTLSFPFRLDGGCRTCRICSSNYQHILELNP